MPEPSARSSDAGLFHDAMPIHTHRHCKNCFRMNRCEGADASKLFRCSRCTVETYCSKECQKEHWKKGHKSGCQLYSAFRDSATTFSGDPKAWSYLTTWIAFHNTTLVNATLAFYLLMKNFFPGDVFNEYILEITLLYHDDPSLPIERRFEVRGHQFAHKDQPGPLGGLSYADTIFRGSREAAVEIGRKHLGENYFATGAYIVMAKFKAGREEGVPFWKHFGIDKESARATPLTMRPLEVLKRNIHEGVKPRFCCGRVPGLPTCCCGGWTHEKPDHAPREGS